MSIKKKIELEISRTNMTVTDFTKKVGISRDGYYKINDKSIKISTLKRIAALFDRPILFFLEEEYKKEYAGGDASSATEGAQDYGKEHYQELVKQQKEKIEELNKELISCKDKVIKLLERKS